jgi:hypothetical protein
VWYNNKNQANGGYMSKKRNVLTAVCVALSGVLSIVCFLLLPDRVTVNINISNEQSYMNKYVAVCFPFFLSVITSVLYNGYGKIFNKEIDAGDWKSGIKYLVFSFVGVLLSLWVLLKNI